MTRAKRKLIKFSNYSFCITLPKKAIDALGWKKGQEVSVNFDEKGKRIQIFKPRVNRKSNGSDKTATTKTKKPAKKTTSIPKLRW